MIQLRDLRPSLNSQEDDLLKGSRYMTMRFKKQAYIGRATIALYITDYTKAVRRKLGRMRLQEDD